MLVQNREYFINQYGKQRGVTVMHRMRTWYSMQFKLAQREKRTADATRFSGLIDHMSTLIKG
ncbi:hypothetical protein HOS22_gp08 [Rhizobium phage RHEph08]|uniref:Uncharacterized protein n=4 Tax=Cuernavacavirus TaxID=2731935 RepID=L7TN17_9CAUD|nr:hypothetical protein HOS21_gp10 [Rhizobium phage RHEph02]YP_009793191.1 hypothetical protein HOS22_gp08 [Rhizobium phage RHEph08]YP_009793247.1 hypothetical protein HOS23_gp05 [Rhizobium phage RHEph09]AGC35637.1 hypothetical protein RHEph03_gp010 [Rhizobium phage RHEph03]AGC35577.1 hypothetical protein RHEph02_gp010 [Rhizobium phage RHEph02]AGC35932.1 hypothetical protein RHEph08_gp008 [Rhizobium phage RHEph08]AGC35988.1 hypothetical protein RHEph09_gp005 [Rhizobium phage RHEph09]